MLRAHLERHDLDDGTVFDAVAMRLAAAIEAISAIDEDTRADVLGDVWPAMWSVRNRLAHGYTYLNRTIVSATVENDLDDFEQALDDLAAAVDPSAG
ncbi:MAG: DUF86 domain-containing protein [Acidimicrobiia bacterium]|jgi:uncharacterized protein with HEPN domain|nr:DUF86 domain-containing protein [Acidimicrobiia bacterium]